MNRKIKSAAGKIVVKVLSEEKSTEAGIIYNTDHHGMRYLKCRAVSVGEVYTGYKGKKINPPCETNDIVFITKPSRSHDFKLDGEAYYSIQFIDVLAVKSIVKWKVMC